MKTVKLLSIAALAFVGALTAGCNSDDKIMDQPQQPQNTNNTVTLTTTVSMDGAAGTRALTSTGVKTFAVGETMALRYKNTKGDWVKAVSNALEAGDIADGSKSATFTFTLTNPDKTQNVDYIYPAAIVNPSGNMDESALFGSQDGTLEKIASTFDYSRKIGAWDGDNLPSLTLENQLAILAITLKNADGSSNITSSITGLTLSDGTKTYNVNRSAAEGPIYVAIYPTADATITVTATDGTKNYTKTLTSKTYAADNGYSVSWRMIETYTLAESTVGMIVGTDGKAYAAADKDNLPTGGVTAAGMVAYKNGSNGLVIALADEANTMNWSTATGASGAAAHTPVVTGGTWKLPSKAEWNQMFGADAEEDIANYMSLNDALAAAGGTAFQEGGYYWSSTLYEEGVPRYVELDCGSAYWSNNGDEDEDRLVRACLAF